MEVRDTQQVWLHIDTAPLDWRYVCWLATGMKATWKEILVQLMHPGNKVSGTNFGGRRGTGSREDVAHDFALGEAMCACSNVAGNFRARTLLLVFSTLLC